MNAEQSKMAVRTLCKVWHIGTLQSADKGCRGASLEGTGLSISQHPESWQRIAKLGGLPWWQLEKAEGRFVDFHGLNAANKAALTTWGLDKGYVSMGSQWVITYYDSELDGNVMCSFDKAADAELEFADMVEDGREAKLAEESMALPTDKMTARLGFSTSAFNALDIVATFWVEDETDFDGIWWNDRHAPEDYSAPRGVIVPRALPSWSRLDTTQ